MRLSEATALVDAEIREHDPDEDIDILCHLAEQAQQFSPIVGLEQLDKKLWAGRSLHQPECLLLDVTGLAALFGGEAALMQGVSHWLDQQNYFGCMAIGGTVGAAWAMANYGTRRWLPPDTAEADPALKPRIVPACRATSLPAGGDAEAVRELSLLALRIAPDTLAALRRLGLRTIGDLEQLPRAGLATRLGELLLTRWDQASGRKDEPILTFAASADWNLEQTLEIPTEHRETIIELVRRLSEELSQRLARRGEGALRLVCRLDLVERPPLVMQLGLFRPTHEAPHLQMLLGAQLEQQLRGVRTAPLWRLNLQATLTAPLVWRQVDLFGDGEVASRNEIASLVDRLSCRLGRKGVLSARVRRESQPELASSFQPMTGRRQDGTPRDTVRKLSSRLSRGRAEPARDDPLRRPLALLNPPLAIEVAGTWRPSTAPGSVATHPPAQPDAAPRALAAAPSHIHHQGTWHQVAEAAGPERLESGWWKGPSARRDYYRVATTRGCWWWIYRDLNTSRWYLHGMFD